MLSPGLAGLLAVALGVFFSNLLVFVCFPFVCLEAIEVCWFALIILWQA